VFSGIQPTGEIHLGNLIGAIRHWVVDQRTDDCLFCAVDLHAITVPQDPAVLRRKTFELVAILLAAGIDPERSIVFVQSHVPQHAELAWVLDCLVQFGELRRMTQFKDKSSRQQEASVTGGLFSYPALMAADILLYRTDRVPVGEDQQQHLELTRDIAMRFNQRFGETFVVPKAAIPAVGARIMDLQDPTSKMSKSQDTPGNIRLIDPPDVLRRKVKTAVTDSGREIVAREDKPAITNLLTILSVATDRPIDELERAYEGKGYADLKRDLAEALVGFLAPFQRRYSELVADMAELEKVLRRGAERATELAAPMLADVYDRVGFVPGGGRA
jgi:tryptophanyl-tRNA synthetase